MPPLCIDLVYFNAGGGHRAAAQALQGALRDRHPDWSVRMVDLFRVLDPEGWFARLTGFAPETYYNKRLATGFTLGLAQELKVLQAMIRGAHPQLVARLARHWQHTGPDMVVSLVPNFNRSMAHALSLVDERVPFVTVMTDLADYPPHFWVEPGCTQHLVCGTDHAVHQALSQGLPHTAVHRVSGMILRPSLYAPAPTPLDREQARQALGFAPGLAVGVVMFGGHGSSVMKRIASALDDHPLILMCGRHDSLARALKERASSAPHQVVGYTDDVASWLRLADYFIGKPGPGSVSEALHCGLPVIVARNAWTMPQERWNTEWVREQRLGLVLGSFREVREGVQQVLRELPALRMNVLGLSNRALDEVVGLLSGIAGQRQAADPHEMAGLDRRAAEPIT